MRDCSKMIVIKFTPKTSNNRQGIDIGEKKEK